jgi:hypothetical protein
MGPAANAIKRLAEVQARTTAVGSLQARAPAVVVTASREGHAPRMREMTTSLHHEAVNSMPPDDIKAAQK